MSFIQQFFTSRDNNANAETFVGQEGRLWWDPISNQIYSSDGNTPGGIPLSGGGGGGSPGGSNSQVQFNSSGTFGGSSLLTFDRVSGALTAVSFAGDGSTLSNIAGANVVGAVTDAIYASSAVTAINAETVIANNQPNINSVGILTSLSVTGNIQTNSEVLVGNSRIYDSNNYTTISGVEGSELYWTDEVSGGASVGVEGIAAYMTTGSIDGTSNISVYPGNVNVRSSGNINLLSNGNTWVFEPTGNLQLPNQANISIDPEWGYTNLNSAPNSVISLQGIATGGASLATVTADGEFGIVNVRVEGADEEFLSEWTFLPDGSIAFPYQKLLGNASQFSGDFRVISTANIAILANLDPTTADSGDDGYLVEIGAGPGANSTVSGTPSGHGGNVYIAAGSGGDTVDYANAGPGGTVYIQGGQTWSFTLPGGNIELVGGQGIYSGKLGNIRFMAGGAGNAEFSSDTGVFSVAGNVMTGNYFIGDGGLLSNINAVTNSINNGTSGVAVPDSNGNVYVTTAAGTPWNFDTTGNLAAPGAIFSEGLISATGNIVTDGYFVGNFAGNITGNIVVPGSNTQVLFNTNGNVDAVGGLTYNKDANLLTVLGTVSAHGNVQSAYLVGNGVYLSSITGANVTGAVANATYAVNAGDAAHVTDPSQSNITSVGTLVALAVTGNVSGNYFVGNGAALTSITGANVAGTVANATYATNAGTVTTAAQPNITSVGTLTGITSTGNISTTGNVTGGYFFGNGSQLTGIASTYGNANVSDYLASGTDTANIITTGNVTGGNLLTGGQLSATGNVSGNWLNAAGGVNVVATTQNILINQLTTGLVAIGGATQTGLMSFGLSNATQTVQFASGATGSGNTKTLNIGASGLANSITNINIGTSAGNGNVSITANTRVSIANTSSTALSVAGNITGGNVLTGGQFSATGNVTGGNIRTAGVVSATSTVFGAGLSIGAGGAQISGNTTVSNLITGGSVSATGNIAGGNLSVTGSIQLGGLITATGNITGGNLLTGANVSATSNITGGNLISNGLITAVSNVIANYFVGNGAALVSITGANVSGTVANATYATSAGSATTATSATTAGTVTTNAQPNITSVGTLTSVTSTGNISTTGNVIAGNIIGTHVGNVTGTTASLSGNVTGGNVLTSGLISSTGNIDGGNLRTTGVVSALGGIISSGEIYSATAVTGGAVSGATVLATGNVTGGNILTGGLISATGNVTGGNIIGTHVGNITGTTASLSGNVTGGNILTGGLISATGNVTVGNITTTIANFTTFNSSIGGNVSGTLIATSANAQFINQTNASGYATVAGYLSVAGNVTGGNILTGGLISATGNITGGNIIGTHVGNLTGTTASLSGNVTGGNLITAGALSSTGTMNLVRTTGQQGEFTFTDGVGSGFVVSVGTGLGTWAGAGSLNLITSSSPGANIGIFVAQTERARFTTTGQTVSGAMSATGNITGGNILTAGTISATGNITAGNILGGANVNATTHTGTTVSMSGNVTGGNVIATTTVYGNAATAFVAGTAAISGVALQMPQEGALRNLNNGSTNMYFDVSTGGSTNGQFQFRSSNSFTNVLTMSPTAFNVNTEAVVTAKTASFGRLAWNSAIDTELTVDNYRFRVSNQGGIFPQIISNTGGTVNSAWTVVAARSGSAISQGGSTGTLVPNNTWTSLYTFGGMDSAGDTFIATLQDKTAGRIYRVTFMRSDNGATTGYNIIAERLI